MHYILMMKVSTIYPWEDHTGFQKKMKVGCISKIRNIKREKRNIYKVIKNPALLKKPKIIKHKGYYSELKNILPLPFLV